MNCFISTAQKILLMFLMLIFSSGVGFLQAQERLMNITDKYLNIPISNSYERGWGNMHWGHAVSKDLIHWEELPVALYPDQHGTMFSGSAVIDYHNTAGFNKSNQPAMVAIYTADNPEKQVQCIAYSLDKGRTWKKHEYNPVIDSKEKWNSKETRDPKVFWYEPGKKWVMVLNERDGNSIYNSTNLKDWTYESHVTGFWECPELFELPVDEVNLLNKASYSWQNLSADVANLHLQEFNDESLLRIKFTLKLFHATSAGLNLDGQSLLNYNMNHNLVNGVFYSPNEMTSMKISADIFIDKTSVEVFIDGGGYSCSFEKRATDPNQGFHFWGNNIHVENLEVFVLKSI
jgi:sucrose-6-phosphate hydrolase SacC (GH32 family)